jgi:hypothetical protein
VCTDSTCTCHGGSCALLNAPDIYIHCCNLCAQALRYCCLEHAVWALCTLAATVAWWSSPSRRGSVAAALTRLPTLLSSEYTARCATNALTYSAIIHLHMQLLCTQQQAVVDIVQPYICTFSYCTHQNKHFFHKC